MVERGIGYSDVVDALTNPVQHVYDSWRDVYIAVSGRGFAVVCAFRGGYYEVLTVLRRREYEALIKKWGAKRYRFIG
jgi:hypothetical protein